MERGPRSKEKLDANPEKFRESEISVIGAGVIGLTTAILAQERGKKVTIYTDTPTDQTTSTKAAASFKPHEVAYTNQTQLMVENGWYDFEKIERDFCDKSGVRKHTHWEASSSPKELTQYLSVMEDFRIFERPDVPGGYQYGWRYQTFFIDVTKYIPWLVKKFKSNNGEIRLVNTLTLESLLKIPSDTIFNCTGLGARDLCNDNNVRPIKGQIAIIPKTTNMDRSISANGFYVYPRANDTVLGGTTEWDIFNENTENGAIHLLVRGNKPILPHLDINQVVRSYAGLRPYRNGEIRVEAEEINDRRIIHHYGHGGSGFTLSWGSAREALKLM